jgi:nicotinate-nucleotide adenylyltransferase
MAARIGVFGGTFDPPHVAHLILAAEARAQLQLSRLLWVPAAVPPHKVGSPISLVEDRLVMLKLALEDEDSFEISMIDIERPGPHFTLDTLRLLSEQIPGSQMILVIGGDSLHDLPDWHRPTEVVAACAEIGVMRRPGDKIDLPELEAQLPGLIAKVRFIDAPLLEISSHEIRERVSNDRPFRYYVPRAVYEYIMERRLYREA